MKGMIGNIVEWAKEILGIHSPSKVFANKIGKWIPAGIAVGIEDNLGVIHSAMNSVSDELLSEGLNARAPLMQQLIRVQFITNTTVLNLIRKLLFLIY